MEYTILFKNGVNFLFTKFTPFAAALTPGGVVSNTGAE